MKLLILLTEGAGGVALADNQNLLNLLSLVVFCLGTASLSQFLMKCMEKGMIFRKYYNVITYWFWLDRKKEITMSHISGLEALFNKSFERKTWIEPKFTPNKYQWLWKVMGGCIWCFSAWTFIVLFIVIVSPIQPLRQEFTGLILGLGLNYLFIEVIQKIKK